MSYLVLGWERLPRPDGSANNLKTLPLQRMAGNYLLLKVILDGAEGKSLKTRNEAPFLLRGAERRVLVFPSRQRADLSNLTSLGGRQTHPEARFSDFFCDSAAPFLSLSWEVPGLCWLPLGLPGCSWDTPGHTWDPKHL